MVAASKPKSNGAISLMIIWAKPTPPKIDWRTGKPKEGKWVKEGDEWVRHGTGERVHPDLKHPKHRPHVDYKDGKGGEWRVYPDRRIELKR